MDRHRSVDQSAHNVRALDICDLREHAPFGEDTLIGHVSRSALRDKIVLVVLDVVDSILELWPDETAVLSIHGLRAKSRRYEVDICSSRQFAFELFLCFRRPLLDLKLHRSVFLYTDTFTTLSVMVHAGLAILRRVDCVPLSKLDFGQFLEAIHLPANESIIVGIRIGSAH